MDETVLGYNIDVPRVHLPRFGNLAQRTRGITLRLRVTLSQEGGALNEREGQPWVC